MKINTTKLTTWIGIIIGVATILSGSWATASYLGVRPVLVSEFQDLQQQVQQNTQSIMLSRFQYLVAKKNSGGGISVEEQLELCKIAEFLKFNLLECK
jgi:hypothetical protein